MRIVAAERQMVRHLKYLILFIALLLAPELGKAQIADLDVPSPSQVVSGQIGMGGWALDTSTSISSVEIILDGVSYGFAGYGGYRPDVCNALGHYSGCPNVGWNFSFNTAVVPDGPHSVNIRVTTTDNRQSYAGAQFVVDNAGAGLSFTTSYRLTNRASGLVLDIQGPTWRPGAIAQQYASINSSNQVYRIYPSNDGFFILESLRSLKALTAAYPYADGAGIQQFEFADLTEQNWQLQYHGGGYYTIINRRSGQVFDLANNGSLQPGNPVVMAANVGSPTQQWSLTPIPDSSLPTVGPEENQDIDPYDVAAPATMSFAEPDKGSGVCQGGSELQLNSVATMIPNQNGDLQLSWAFTDSSGRRPFLPGKPTLDTAWTKGFGKWNAKSYLTQVTANRSDASYPNLGIIYGTDNNTGGGCAGALILATPTKIAYSRYFIESADHDTDSAAVIASHEIGHVLGLNHISSGTPSIMNQPHNGTVEDQCINPLNHIFQSGPTDADAANAQTCLAQARRTTTNQVGETSPSNVFFTITYDTCSFYMSDWDFYDEFDNFAYSHPVIYGGNRQ